MVLKLRMDVTDVIIFSGLGLICYGAFLLYAPLAFVFAGICLASGGFLFAAHKGGDEE